MPLRMVVVLAILGLAFSPSTMAGSTSPSGTMPTASVVENGRAMTDVLRLFISGHSLTNQPVPMYLEAIAKGAGIDLSWNRQYLEGASIRQRSSGSATNDVDDWSGYTSGLDYRNAPVDVLSEFRRPSRHPELAYDALLITEQHGLLGSLVWNQTARYLRDFHDRFITHNSKGRTYFYESWLSLDSKTDPSRWIAYERAAAPVWRCVVAEINAAIAAEGRSDRIVSLPAAVALAELIERATQGGGVPGVTRETVQATIASLVEDNVHLTNMGSYYVALVTFSYIFQRSPFGAWHPPEISSVQASALQDVAASIVSQPPSAAMPIEVCRDYVRKSFMWTYLSYFHDVFWRNERGYMRALYARLQVSLQWWRLFSSDGPENPLSKSAFKRR